MNIWNITLFWSSKCYALIDGTKSRKMSVVNQFWLPFYYRVHVIPNPIRHTSVPFQNLKRSLRTTKKVNFTFRWVFCAIRNTKIFERIVLFLNNNRMYFCKKKTVENVRCGSCQWTDFEFCCWASWHQFPWVREKIRFIQNDSLERFQNTEFQTDSAVTRVFQFEILPYKEYFFMLLMERTNSHSQSENMIKDSCVASRSCHWNWSFSDFYRQASRPHAWSHHIVLFNSTSLLFIVPFVIANSRVLPLRRKQKPKNKGEILLRTSFKCRSRDKN